MSEIKNNPVAIKNGTYRHTKSGNLYEVIGVALQTETDEELVIYRPLTTDSDVTTLYARPLSMFSEAVKINGRVQLRFEHMRG